MIPMYQVSYICVLVACHDLNENYCHTSLYQISNVLMISAVSIVLNFKNMWVISIIFLGPILPVNRKQTENSINIALLLVQRM